MKNSKLALLMIICSAFLFQGCGKGSSNSTTVSPLGNTVTGTTVNQNRYSWTGTSCIDSTTSSFVDSSLCGFTNGVNNGINPNNGNTGVNPYNPGGTSSPAQSQQCFGTFLHQSGGTVQCNGFNCSGQVLYYPNSLTPVYCP